MICNPIKIYFGYFFLSELLWASVWSVPQTNTRGEEHSPSVTWPYTVPLSLRTPMCCLWIRNATHLLSVPQGTQMWQRGCFGAPFPREPVQNGNQPCCSCVLIQDLLACEQHRHFSWLYFRLFAEKAKSPAPWKEKKEHRAKLLVKINSAV